MEKNLDSFIEYISVAHHVLLLNKISAFVLHIKCRKYVNFEFVLLSMTSTRREDTQIAPERREKI